MTETLYIRLGSNEQDIVHWLIWSENNAEIIASGELANASALEELTEKAQTRQVICLVSASDIALKQLTVPGNSQRAIRQATPYILEDSLAQDVEQLFFAYADPSTFKTENSNNNCFVAVVERAQLTKWQAWLSHAQIACKEMIPDCLALPMEANASDQQTFSAVTLGEQLLLRQSAWQGMTVEQNLWPIIETQLLVGNAVEDHDNHEQKGEATNSHTTINSYSALTTSRFNVQAMPAELPLALLATHAKALKFNLLQGEFKVKQVRSDNITNWLSVAAFFAVALLLTFFFKGLQLQQLSAQQTEVKNHIVKVYKKAFPKTRRVNVATVRSQLKRKLASYGSATSQEGFLTMLAKVRPAFATVSQFKVQSLKFDSKRQELRLQASANDYQSFEKFKIALEKAKLTVSQGSLNNQDDQVTGSFSIKR